MNEVSPKMGSVEKKKAFTTGKLRTCLTFGFVVLSAAAFGARHYLEKNNAAAASADKVHVKAEYVDAADGATGSLSAGSTVTCERGVKITQGEGYVRFNIELLDSDGTPIDQKLQDKLSERAELEAMADPEMASYRAFQEGIYWTYNDYNQLTAKGELALDAFCRSMSEDAISHNRPYSTDDLAQLKESGGVSTGFDSDDLVIVSDETEPFKRTVICTQKYSEGDVCSLYDYIVLPVDWQYANTEFDGYTMNAEGDMEECYISVNNMELLGEGFSLRVTADVVDAADFNSAAAAFKAVGK